MHSKVHKMKQRNDRKTVNGNSFNCYQESDNQL